MQINNFYKKLLKVIISISVLECLYLFALPPVANHFLNKDYIRDYVKNNTNAQLDYEKAGLRTHVLPYLTLKAKTLDLSEKETNNTVLHADNLDVKFSIIPLLKKKFNIKHIYSSNTKIFVDRDTDGKYNFEKLFKSDKKSDFKLHYGSIKLALKDYEININDETVKESVCFKGEPLIIKNKLKKNHFKFKTAGTILTGNEKSGDYDFDLKIRYPLAAKKDVISGDGFIYNLNLNILEPLVQKYTNNKIAKLKGYIDYLQLSADKENNQTQVSFNTLFNDLVFDMEGWQNYIQANGENKVDSSLELVKNIVKINSFNYRADKVNVKGNGSVEFDVKPILDLNIEVKDSRAEKIAAILPPNLVPEYKTIEKIKHYGIYGDLEGKVSVKGQVPKPDITGYAKGRDVYILDKPIRDLHKGTVDITFNKNILNMDILVEMPNNQSATVKGYTYMFRDGINDVNIKTTDNLDFPLAQKIIIPVSKVFNFMLGPIPEMDITSGKGIIDMNIRGAIDFIDMHGYSKFDKANLTYNGLYAKILNGKGRLDFDGDVIKFKSDKVYVKNNFVNVNGKVKINDYLDFDISTPKAEAKDLLELINNSPLLKDVKAGLAIITKASGPMSLTMNITANIVPVPYGFPPLPPEEAFTDMKVKGKVNLFGNSCNIIGFDVPLNSVKGNVDFTETVVNINNLDAVSGKSPVNIKGKVINDLKTKVPDVDMTVESKSVYLGDTIKFLTESYLYPKNFPDISVLYNLNSQHDLYFKYKAKSLDFLTNKAYAVMNFIKDDSDDVLKAKDGRIIMKNANVQVDNVNADLFGSNLNIKGNVLHVDRVNPVYNIVLNTEQFDLNHLNQAEDINLIPAEAKNLLKQFKDFKGLANVNVKLEKNIIDGKIDLFKPSFKHIETGIPFVFDDFSAQIKNDAVKAENITATVGNLPFFGNINLSNIYKEPNTDTYFTTKVTNEFIQKYLPKEISETISVSGDINLSSEIKGNQNNLTISPKLTFFPDANAVIAGTSIGDVTEKREFNGNINIKNNFIDIKKFDYIKYISSQNNTLYPVVFATGNGKLNIDKKNNIFEPIEAAIKTEKNISAKILNVFMKKPVFKQGSFSCDLKYIFDKANKKAALKGNLDARNLDIPLFDTVVKNIKIDAKEDNIDVNLFGFLNDSRIRLSSVLENNLYKTPKFNYINIYADKIDNDKMLQSLSKAQKSMKTNNENKNTDLFDLHIESGTLEIKELIIKSMVAQNFKSNFSITNEGIFTADNITVDVGQGNIEGKVEYDLNSSKTKGDFELTNVDANYVAETLLDGKNQIYGNANGKIIINTQGTTNKEIIKNLSGLILFEITDGRMPKLGSLEYLLRASNIIKSGITGFTINSILELLNLVKTGYFSNINGSCMLEDGIAKNIEIFSTGENLSLYIHGEYDISNTTADMEVLGKLSRRISTIFGKVGNTSLNTFFKLIPGISMLDFGRKDFIEDVEKIPSFTNGDYEARVFQAIINGDINASGYVQSFKWVKN